MVVVVDYCHLSVVGEGAAGERFSRKGDWKILECHVAFSPPVMIFPCACLDLVIILHIHSIFFIGPQYLSCFGGIIGNCYFENMFLFLYFFKIV